MSRTDQKVESFCVAFWGKRPGNGEAPHRSGVSFLFLFSLRLWCQRKKIKPRSGFLRTLIRRNVCAVLPAGSIRLPPGGGSRVAGGGARATISYALFSVERYPPNCPQAPFVTLRVPPSSRRKAFFIGSLREVAPHSVGRRLRSRQRGRRVRAGAAGD